MESLKELKDWDQYRAWMRKYLKLMSGERETFYVSKARIDFQISDKPWKGHAVLLGKKSRMLSQRMRQEGCLFLEGTCTSDGKKVTIDGFSEKYAVGAERLFRKLKLGFEIVGGDAADDADDADGADGDPLEARWKALKAKAFPEIKTALTSSRDDVGELKRRAKPMTVAERNRDWGAALKALESVMELVNGAPPVSAESNARLAALSPDELVKTDLTLGDTDELFGEDYMERLMEEPIQGEGSPKLKELMREVEKGLAGARRQEVMADLATIVGIPPTADKLDVDYGRFLVVRKQQTVNGVKKGEDVGGLDEGMHPEFMASRSQLLFGKVLGDAFGIHEVFASLLSPTGGLVGPGNWLIPGVVKAGHLAPDNPVALHGTVHDAAGYLKTFHGEGPGYNYRDSSIEILGTDSPLSGQISGIAYWVAEAGDEYVVHRVEAAVVEVEKKLKSARDAVASEVDKAVAAAQKAADQAVAAAEAAAEEAREAAQRAADEVEQAAQEVADAIKEARDSAEETAVETYEDATEALGVLRDEASRQLNAAWDYIWN